MARIPKKQPTKLYQVIKERWEPQYHYRDHSYTAPTKPAKREYDFRTQKGHVTQALNHARAHNESMQRRHPEKYAAGLCTTYKVFVSVAPYPEKFTPLTSEE